MTIAPGRPTLTIASSPASTSAGYTVTLMEQPGELVGRALVVVVDDRTAHGTRRITTGRWSPNCSVRPGFVVDGVVVVSADEIEIRNALNTAVIGGVDLVISVGGTGVTPRDVTPEATTDHPGPRTARHLRGAARVGAVRRASSTRGCPAGWPVSRAARWWSTSPVRVARCATAWPLSARWPSRSSASSPAWRSDPPAFGRAVRPPPAWRAACPLAVSHGRLTRRSRCVNDGVNGNPTRV